METFQPEPDLQQFQGQHLTIQVGSNIYCVLVENMVILRWKMKQIEQKLQMSSMLIPGMLLKTTLVLCILNLMWKGPLGMAGSKMESRVDMRRSLSCLGDAAAAAVAAAAAGDDVDCDCDGDDIG